MKRLWTDTRTSLWSRIELALSSALHAAQWTDFLILIKLQTCHPNQHSESASEKTSLMQNVCGTAQKSAYTSGECNLSFCSPSSDGELIPGLVSHLTDFNHQKPLCLISGHLSGFSQNKFSSPPTHSSYALCQLVSQAVGESLFVLPPTESMKD